MSPRCRLAMALTPDPSPEGRGEALGRPAWPWATGGFRSSTWPAENNPCRTKTAPCGSSSTAKSTTSATSEAASKRPGTSSAPIATPRCWSTFTRTKGPSSSPISTACSPWPYGTPGGSSCCLARDRLGKKPLVYRCESGRLMFASELKALLQVPGVPREIDPQALDEYLTYQYVPHPRTIFRGIAKLPPGHYALWRDGRLDVQPFWQPDFNAEQWWPAEEYARELKDAADLVGRDAFAERSAAGGVPLGRDRLDDHRRADVATGGRAGADLFHRLSRQRVRRNALRPGGGRAVRHDPRGVPGPARRDGGLAPAGLALR